METRLASWAARGVAFSAFPFHRKVHPLIQAEFDDKKAHAQAKISLYSVCEHVAKHRGWGTRHKMAMAAATAEDFVLLIRTLEITELKILFHQMMDFLTQKSVYGDDFGAAANRFAEACRNIVNAQDSGRLGRLIKALFDDAKVAELLVPPTVEPAAIIANVDGGAAV